MTRPSLAIVLGTLALSVPLPTLGISAARSSPEASQAAKPAREALFVLKFGTASTSGSRANGQPASQSPEELGLAVPVLERRLAGLGVDGRVAIASDRLVVRVASGIDRERVAQMLTQTGRLTFQLLDDNWTPSEGKPPPDDEIAGSANSNCSAECVFALKRKVLLTGDIVASASQGFDSFTGVPCVNFQLNNRGTRAFAEATSANTGKRIAIVLDGKVLTAPVIEAPIPGGQGVIEGAFTVASASDLAVLLQSGQLHRRLIVVEQR